jgi:hypothetical protein
LKPLTEGHAPSFVGKDYLIISIVGRRAWRKGQKGPMDYETLFANLHDFTYQPETR